MQRQLFFPLCTKTSFNLNFYGTLERGRAQFHFNYMPVVAHSTAHNSPADPQIIELKFKLQVESLNYTKD